MACSLAPWSMNQEGQTPCEVVQMLDNSCSYTYTTIPSSSSEDSFIPAGSNVTSCSCCWASYNLLSACMYCSSGSPSLVSWNTWTHNCGSLTSTSTYFPWDSGIRLPSNTSIPYYAVYNPSTYSNGIFDVNIASPSGGQSKPDVMGAPLSSTSSVSSSSSSTAPVGAIAGGVIGGIVLLLLLCGFLFFIIYRKRKRATSSPPKMTPLTRNGSHFAVPTRDTSRAPLAPSGYPQTSAPMSTSPYTHQSNHTRGVSSMTSLQSLRITSPISSGHATMSPLSPPVIPTSSPINDAADVITPFLATQPLNRPTTPDRKNAQGSADPTPERSTSPQTITPRRMNPPAYTPTSPTSPSHVRPGSRKGSGSGDTTINSVTNQRRMRASRMHSGGSADSTMSISTTASVGIRTALERTTTSAASRGPAV
ncbi:uncharacterized protein EDB91DRAFT_1081605 [Suillus paluster]|uniref:uncharacterized protein n=1 Tax=Suillus paluster TaxID=48578 RepID=UPI001B85E283|nr:uncharacterized protein EDB91DRAFT_1081605 [Suillus paluster]KAG1741803.1 hypothetical protein EDB91DRAFT_1081605 [Suillus paluster]